jgi:serine/threonine protein kinase
MCHQTAASIAPRIVALLTGETIPWTGNEILGRIVSGDFPCEAHFDEAIRQLVRERKITSESDVFAPTLTSTTRCRLAYILAPETKAPSIVQPPPGVEKPRPAVIVPPPPPPAPPAAAPALPSPAARLEAIGRLRDEKARAEREWFGRFGADCFRNGSAGFVKTLFAQARIHGILPRLRDALERSQNRRFDDFDRHCENLLLINDRDGTIPAVMINAGVKLDLMYYVALDLARAERDVQEGKEGNPSNAREILAFLKEAFDQPSLGRTSAETPAPDPRIGDRPVHSGSTAIMTPVLRGPAPEPKAPPADPLIGSTFGPYKIVTTVGRGGMGAVYEGLDETLDRRVALKVLHPQFADNREYQDRFLREARNAANAKLDHPNITQIYAAGRQGAHLWLAMQFVRGRTLSKILEERKKLPSDEALGIVRQTAEGLAAAHSAQMIHRDIKPDNLMIDESGRVKIMDFGLMRSTDVKKDGLTQDGLFVGTLEYASPEQCQDKVLDARTDLYSLGVVLYQLLSGARPYTARTAFGYLSMVPDPGQPPVPLRQQNPEVPAAVESLVHRMISKKPEDRFGSAQEVILAIDGVLSAPRRVEPADRPPNPAAKKAIVSLIGWSIALAAVIAAAFILWPSKPNPAAPPVSKSPPVVELPRKDPEPPVVREPKPVPVQPPEPKSAEPKPPVFQPPPPVAPRDPRLALLTDHRPDAKELDLLEQLLVLSRATLAARSGYAFEEAADKIFGFSRAPSLTAWVALFAEAEGERIQAATRAFQVRPLLEGKDERVLELRDGRSLRGRVAGEIGGRLTVESADGGREGVLLAIVSPTTFPVARGAKLEAVRVRSAAGDATGALPLLDGLEEFQRLLLAPLLLDQAIEELLCRNDPKAIAVFEPPAAHRGVADALLKARMKSLALEKEAAATYLRLEEEGSLKNLLTAQQATRAGSRAARETLEAFEKSLPEDEKFELVSPGAWGTWDADARDATNGTVVFDKVKNVYVLTAASTKEQVRLLKKLKGSERGYRIRWSFGPGGSDAAAFMVALSFTRWFEVGSRGVSLFRVDKEGAEEKVSTARKVELPDRLARGVLHVLPRAALVLVYLNGRLLFSLPEKDYALGGGLQLGMSGGSITLESIRVLDRTRD